MEHQVRLTISGQEVTVPASATILEAANRAGISIPTLCYYPGLKPSGSCRLCAVEINDYRGLPAACTTPKALTEVAASLRRYRPDEVAVLTSAKCTK